MNKLKLYRCLIIAAILSIPLLGRPIRTIPCPNREWSSVKECFFPPHSKTFQQTNSGNWQPSSTPPIHPQIRCSFNEGHALRHIGRKAPRQVIQRKDGHTKIPAMPPRTPGEGWRLKGTQQMYQASQNSFQPPFPKQKNSKSNKKLSLSGCLEWPTISPLTNSRNCLATWLPMKPAAPVTSAVLPRAKATS